MNCAGCGQPRFATFRVLQLDRTEKELGRWDVCSIVCLIRWAYKWGGRQGALALQALQRTINKISQAFRGPA